MKQDSNIGIDNHIWTKHKIPQDEPLKVTIGPLTIWCIRENKELRIAWNRCKEIGEVDDAQLPEKLEWQRWAFKQKNPSIELKPVFPDRPILIKPENPFKITEEASVRIYVRVPIWIRITLIGDPSTHLIEIPIITLSNTWFGTYQEGDLCYWISSGARLSIEPDVTKPFLAICPLQLIDRSPDDLNVEKICLRVEHLSLYLVNGQLWSGETTITYRGTTDVSEVKYNQTSPKEVRKAIFISKPRTKLIHSITAKTFSTIKDLPGFGLLLKE